jgi:DNA-directed RNA polymerase III subunit RPC2
LKHNSLTEDIPIAIIFKGLGITSDQEIIQLIGLEEYIMETLTPCIYEAHSHQIFTQAQVNKWQNYLLSNQVQKSFNFLKLFRH